jgi:hypothetical protein
MELKLRLGQLLTISITSIHQNHDSTPLLAASEGNATYSAVCSNQNLRREPKVNKMPPHVFFKEFTTEMRQLHRSIKQLLPYTKAKQCSQHLEEHSMKPTKGKGKP